MSMIGEVRDENIPGKLPARKRTVKSILLHESNEKSNVLLGIIWSKRPLVFVLPKIKPANLKELMDRKNYSIRSYDDFIIGIRNDLKVLGVNLEVVFATLCSDFSMNGLDKFVDSALDGRLLDSSPFSKEDELDILSPIL